jgi:3-oxoacyl-ACP reductase-like protein
MEGQIEKSTSTEQQPAQQPEQKPQQQPQAKKQPPPEKQPAPKKAAPAAGEKVPGHVRLHVFNSRSRHDLIFVLILIIQKAKKDEIRLKKEFHNTTPKGEKKGAYSSR